MLDQAFNAIGREQYAAEFLAVEVHYSIPRGRAGTSLDPSRLGRAAGDAAWRIMCNVDPVAGVRKTEACREYAAMCWDELELAAQPRSAMAWMDDVMMRVRVMENCVQSPLTIPGELREA